MGYVVTFVLGGMVFLWAFGSAGMRPAAVYLTVVVVSVVVARLVRLLWFMWAYDDAVRRQSAPQPHDDAPRRPPRKWVAVDWPDDTNEPKPPASVDTEDRRPTLAWPDDTATDRRY